MNCDDVENTILERFDQPIRCEYDDTIVAHLRSCGRCAKFASGQGSLHDQLSTALVPFDLPGSFPYRLRKKIVHTQPLSDALPDIVHLTSCLVAMLVVAAIAPALWATVLSIGTVVTA